MMAMFRFPGGWDVFENFRSFQRDLENLMGRGTFGESRRIGGGTYPPVNVLNGPEDMIVQCELAGVRREDVDISITAETLAIKGAKHAPDDDEKLNYTRRERGFGQFSRTIVLPDKVDPDRIEATLTGGILTIRLPKSQAAKPKQIEVK